jgi:murein DD-endopeptidase MepM/ murein hydrolase activator NlpD
LFSACSEIQKAADFITNPSAKEVYERGFKDRPALFSKWEKQTRLGLEDSIAVELPYVETGKFFSGIFSIYAYEIELNRGQVFQVEVETDSSQLVFLDFYRKKNDSLREFEHLESAEFGENSYRKEIEEPGTYKILVQPEIGADAFFQIVMTKKPIYAFPVAGKSNAAIHSYWGAPRDGGARSHEGIDIFATRGTPVLATTKGRVGFAGKRGLGGKQVWLRDGERNLSLYYAHLDSIAVSDGESLSVGDTLGFVGNTGNARTTPPHLHFGIYKGFDGAINPLYFVRKTEEPDLKGIPGEEIFADLLQTQSVSNLRSGASLQSEVLSQAEQLDTFRFLGKTEDWFHVRRDEKAYFVHESLVTKLKGKKDSTNSSKNGHIL